MSEGRLLGKVALVAGAGRGIGRAVALAYAAEGARLALVARTATEVDETATLCRARGTEAISISVDVADWPAVAALPERITADLGPVDVLVNAAGIYGPIGPTISVDPTDWTGAIETNLYGTFYLCRAVAPGMAERRRGKIVLMAGGGAAAPLPFFSAYAASKAAAVRFADTLAAELAEKNVQVNAIAPGLVDTRLQDDVLAAGPSAGPLLDKIRDARERGIGTVPPELAASLAVYLASDTSGDLTGKLISAPHDPWQDWSGPFTELNASPLFTIRRVDRHTVEPLLHELAADPER